MILLDTNVVSEQMREKPSLRVLNWFEEQGSTPLYIATISEAELFSGLAAMPNGKNKAAKSVLLSRIMAESFAGRVLAFDSAAARAYGELYQARKALNGKDDVIDCQLAAIAKVHGLKLATRNVRDFEGFGLELVNPWD